MPSERDRFERRIYRAGDDSADSPARRRSSRTPSHESGSARRAQRRSPVLALLVIVVIAVVIAFAGLAARDGGLSGPQGQTGTFKLIPLSTTTTS
jgi:hypothetical protein